MKPRNGNDMAKKLNHIGDLTPDPRNARKHTPRNVGMVEASLREVGAARSIVIDEDGVILAGNATIEAAAAAGIERVQVVDADGDTIVAVRRSGLTAEQKTRLALYDNRAAELAEWDPEVLRELEAADVEGMFSAAELAALVDEPSEESPRESDSGGITEQFLVVVTCPNEQEQLALIERMMQEGRPCKALMS